MLKKLYIPIDTTLENTVNVEKLIKRGDTLELTIKVFENGLLANLTGETVLLTLRKTDGTNIDKTISNISNGIITVQLNENATLSEGFVNGELLIYDGATIETSTHSSTNTFTFFVVSTLTDDILNKISTDDIQTLADLRNAIDTTINAINNYVDEITIIAGTAESVQALVNTKAYIDANLANLQNETAQATIQIPILTSENTKAETNIATLQTFDDVTGEFQTLKTKINNLSVINVKDFGAKGDWNGTTGTDDTTFIQNVINSSIEGSTIYIPDGTFIISSLIINKKLNFVGNYGKSTLRLKDNSNSTILNISNVDNIIVKDLILDGNKSNNNIQSVGGSLGIAANSVIKSKFENLIFKDWFNYGLQLSLSSDNIITSCMFVNCLIPLRLINKSHYNIIEKNYCENNVGGIFIYSENDNTKQCKFNKILNNFISGNTEPDVNLGHGSGVSLYDAPFTTVKGNTIKDSSLRGIYIFVGSDHCIVCENTIIGVGYTTDVSQGFNAAIDVDTVNYCNISHNNIYDCYGGGIFMSGNVCCEISSNIIRNIARNIGIAPTNDKPSLSGIIINEANGDGSGPVFGNIISGNQIIDIQATHKMPYGIIEWLGLGSYYNHNTISNNIILNSTEKDLEIKSLNDIVIGNSLTYGTNATLYSNGFSSPISAIATNNVIVTDIMNTIMVNSEFIATLTVTLPDASIRYGRKFTIVRTSATNNVSIIGTNSQQINGSSSYSLTGAYNKCTVQSNGSGWIVVG